MLLLVLLLFVQRLLISKMLLLKFFVLEFLLLKAFMSEILVSDVLVLTIYINVTIVKYANFGSLQVSGSYTKYIKFTCIRDDFIQIACIQDTCFISFVIIDCLKIHLQSL